LPSLVYYNQAISDIEKINRNGFVIMNKMRLPILKIWVDPVNMKQALERVSEYVEKGDRLHTVFASNPEKNFSFPADAFLYQMFRNADMLVPDGIGVVMAARFLYGLHMERVPGCELMQNVCAMSADKGYKIFIYGAKDEINKKAVETLRNKYPNIRIAGHCNGYLPKDKMDDLVRQINDSGAQILFLALGSPNQERWIAEYGDKLKHIRVCQGTGGTLDVIAGAVKRAPDIYCRLGLEWFYRLIDDPARIKRQKMLPVFAFLMAVEKIKMFLAKVRFAHKSND
jgi:N-acetylglucosaminyldiphosphoundecaprenol N-acetyl-beta-D-mannosaminyltransferase